MNIAIVGSREGFRKEEVEKVMLKEFNLDEDRLITGGARGVDSFADEIVQNNDDFAKDSMIIEPINTSSKINYLFRNIEIITLADRIIAFWDGKSKGTKFVIDYAIARNKDIEVINNG